MPGPLSPEVLRAAILNLPQEERELSPAQGPPSQEHHSKALFRALGLPVMAGGQVADAVSTSQALKRTGTHESNPIYGQDPSMGRVLATKAAIMGPSAWLLDKLAEKHPKLALGIALAIGGGGAAIAAHNTGVGKK